MNDERERAEFVQYRRTQIAEMADWTPSFDMAGVSVSEPDRKAGSPKTGDKIARNPANHEDRWLVAAAYFAANFEPLAATPTPAQAPAQPVAHICILETKDAGPTKFFTAPSDPRGFPVYAAAPPQAAAQAPEDAYQRARDWLLSGGDFRQEDDWLLSPEAASDGNGEQLHVDTLRGIVKHALAAAPAQAAQPLTELQRMKIIGEEFPIALVQPIVIAKVDSVCLAIERAHGIGATQTPRPNEPELGADGGAQGKEER